MCRFAGALEFVASLSPGGDELSIWMSMLMSTRLVIETLKSVAHSGITRPDVAGLVVSKALRSAATIYGTRIF